MEHVTKREGNSSLAIGRKMPDESHHWLLETVACFDGRREEIAVPALFGIQVSELAEVVPSVVGADTDSALRRKRKDIFPQASDALDL